jgi:exopolyphosphatase/guanosine-5'-triphosphate,3'-diphosphate pyrophosphatase
VFAAITRVWPAPRVVVADRGLREGMLLRLMRADRQRHRPGSRSAPRSVGGPTPGSVPPAARDPAAV